MHYRTAFADLTVDIRMGDAERTLCKCRSDS